MLAEANKKQLEVEPIRGEDLKILAREVMAQSPEVIERLKNFWASDGAAPILTGFQGIA